jgi:hypothetical protein
MLKRWLILCIIPAFACKERETIQCRPSEAGIRTEYLPNTSLTQTVTDDWGIDETAVTRTYLNKIMLQFPLYQ